jgi:hypothetical protein
MVENEITRKLGLWDCRPEKVVWRAIQAFIVISRPTQRAADNWESPRFRRIFSGFEIFSGFNHFSSPTSCG